MICLTVDSGGASRADLHLAMQILQASMKGWMIADPSSGADLTRSFILEDCIGISDDCVCGSSGFVTRLNRSVFLSFPHINRSSTGGSLRAT
jgi:hypothetical protein